MKKIMVFLIALTILLPFNIKAQDKVNVYVFHGRECPHCAAAIKYIKSVETKYNLDVFYYEVWHNTDNYDIMKDVKINFGDSGIGVPYIVIGEKTFTGFADYTKNDLVRAFDSYTADNKDFVTLLNGGVVTKNDPKEKEEIRSLPILGDVNVKAISIPLVAAIIGSIDGFNPCAMWILLFLISMLLGMKDRKKMWILGLSFLLTSASVYFLVMMTWINITASFSTIVWIRTLIALIAIGGGFLNLKSYFKKKDDGCEVMDDKKRDRIFDKIKRFTTEKSFILSLFGVIAVAASVNIVELACSAGLPLLFTQILVVNKSTPTEYLAYTLIYILFFLLDDLIVFFIAMKSLKLTGFSSKYGKYSHLIGGLIMVIIGILLIFKPEWIMLNF